jgi:Ca2+-binding RTX toxin-like protein
VRGGIAFDGADGDDILVNSGKMRGDVDLRTGDDIFYTRGGIVTGKITGGDGDDLFLTDNASYHMLENANEGYDTVKSTVSYTLNANVEVLILLGGHDIDGTGNTAANRLLGNKGDNVLNGKDGEDTLNGKAGDDRLIGGGGDDLFVFATGYDNDVITHFDNGTDEFGMDGDKIDVSGWKAIHGFAGIKNHLEVHGDDLVIHAGGDSLTILNMPRADLDAGDFIFGGVGT